MHLQFPRSGAYIITGCSSPTNSLARLAGLVLSAPRVCPGGGDGGFDGDERPISAALHNTSAHHGRGHLRYGEVSFFRVLSHKQRAAFGGGVYSIVMHGRSCMTIDPRTVTMPGQSTSDFYRPGKHLLAPSAKALRGVGRVA